MMKYFVLGELFICKGQEYVLSNELVLSEGQEYVLVECLSWECERQIISYLS